MALPLRRRYFGHYQNVLRIILIACAFAGHRTQRGVFAKTDVGVVE
jgi:hypothetical protein